MVDEAPQINNTNVEAVVTTPQNNSPTPSENNAQPTALAPIIDNATTIIQPLTQESKSAPTLLSSTEAPKVEAKIANTNIEKKTEAKTAEEPVEKLVEAKTEESKVSQSDEPASLPTYDEFKLPEGIIWDKDKIGNFQKSLGEFEKVSKADHVEVQKFGQGLLEKYSTDLKFAAESFKKTALDAFEKTKTDWKEDFIKDPEIGGNKQNTTIEAAREFIRTHGGNETEQKEISDLMDQTGVGNHKAMIRMLAKANSALAEGKSIPASRPFVEVKSKVMKRYGTM
jgi:hypothetical protein